MYRGVIIGCGSIGALKDNEFDRPGGENIFTIAHAMFDHPRVNIIHMSDIDNKKETEARIKWQVTKMLDNESAVLLADIIAISVPTEFHLEVLAWILAIWEKHYTGRTKPRVVLLEKPAGHFRGLERMNIPENVIVGINYSRRYAPGISGLSDALTKSKIYAVTCYYNRGLYRDGCHALDLLSWFLGDFKSVYTVPSPPIDDYDMADPSSCLHLEFEACRNVFMIPVDGNDISVFDVELMTSTGKYLLHNSSNHLTVFEPKRSQYGPYQTLSESQFTMKTGMHYALTGYLQEAVQVLDGKRKEFSCTIQDAVNVHKIIEEARSSRYARKQRF